MAKIKDISGQRFGKLVAINCIGVRATSSGKNTAYWNVVCDCGLRVQVDGANLRTGNTKSCGYCQPTGDKFPQNIEGRVFGQLEVIRQVPCSGINKRWKESRRWVCRCSCGREIVLPRASIVSGVRSCSECKDFLRKLPNKKHRLQPISFVRRDSDNRRIYRWKCDCGNVVEKPVGPKSCGCIEREQIRATFRDAAQKVMSQYRKDASKRGYEWALSEDQFYGLITSPCHYTGFPPSKLIKTQEGDFFWNGVDRVDNTRGYVPDNVVPCSDHANWAKCTRKYDDFIAWLKQVAIFWKDRI